MQVFSRIPKSLIIVIIVLIVLAILVLGGIVLVRTNKNISSKLSGIPVVGDIANLSSNIDFSKEFGTNIEFKSNIPGIYVSMDIRGKDTLKYHLQKLNLLPLSHKPFIGGFLGYPAIITPSKVTIEFRDLMEENSDLTKDHNLVKRKLLEEQGFDAYYIGNYDKNTQELTIPIYVSKDKLNNNGDIFLTTVALESLFLNFRDTSIQLLGKNPTDAFHQLVETVNGPAVLIKPI